ncbi:MAG: zinc-ribbon domain-containing protein [Desulfobacterales bacterium]|nr:zinc-ribbon domain-containing protein [Desulfobacterales bacterium]
MIVMCEGCETNFQVEDHFIKSTGSKVRCSKCRHVFTAHSPAALAVAEEPLVLSETLPADSSTSVESELPDISSQIDGLFADDLGVAADTASDPEPEELDVEDLLADDSPLASALTKGDRDDDLKLDVDLDLDFDEETTAQSPSVDVPVQPAHAISEPADFALDTEPVSRRARPATLWLSLDELGIKLDALEGIGDESPAAAAEANEHAGAETLGLDLDLEMDLNALVAETADEVNPEAMRNRVGDCYGGRGRQNPC